MYIDATTDIRPAAHDPEWSQARRRHNAASTLRGDPSHPACGRDHEPPARGDDDERRVRRRDDERPASGHDHEPVRGREEVIGHGFRIVEETEEEEEGGLLSRRAPFSDATEPYAAASRVDAVPATRSAGGPAVARRVLAAACVCLALAIGVALLAARLLSHRAPPTSATGSGAAAAGHAGAVAAGTPLARVRVGSVAAPGAGAPVRVLALTDSGGRVRSGALTGARPERPQTSMRGHRRQSVGSPLGDGPASAARPAAGRTGGADTNGGGVPGRDDPRGPGTPPSFPDGAGAEFGFERGAS